MSDFLEVESLDEREELILSILDGIVDQTVREEHRVVGHLELTDGLTDADFEFLLRLDSVADALAQLLKARWVNEEEVAFQCLSIDLNGALNIDFNDRNLAS